MVKRAQQQKELHILLIWLLILSALFCLPGCDDGAECRDLSQIVPHVEKELAIPGDSLEPTPMIMERTLTRDAAAHLAEQVRRLAARVPKEAGDENVQYALKRFHSSLDGLLIAIEELLAADPKLLHGETVNRDLFPILKGVISAREQVFMANNRIIAACSE